MRREKKSRRHALLRFFFYRVNERKEKNERGSILRKRIVVTFELIRIFFSSRSYLHCIRNESRRKRENESEKEQRLTNYNPYQPHSV